MPGHSRKVVPAAGKNDPVTAPPTTRTADRNSPAIRPNIGRTDCANLDQLIAKAKSQIANINHKSLLKNKLSVAIICLFCFQGWRGGHGRQGLQANPSLSLPRVSVT